MSENLTPKAVAALLSELELARQCSLCYSRKGRHTKACAITRALAYIRQLEQEHRTMRAVVEKLEPRFVSDPFYDPDIDNICANCKYVEDEHDKSEDCQMKQAQAILSSIPPR